MAGMKKDEGWNKERRYQRTGCDLDAQFLYRDKWRPAKLITLSGGGAFVACSPRLKPNQVIFLEFGLEGGEVAAISRVVWHTGHNGDRHRIYPPGFAVEFESMDSRDRALVNRFVIKSLRILRALIHELDQLEPDLDQIRSLFLIYRPEDSLRINHIRKVVREEYRHFRLRKIDCADKS